MEFQLINWKQFKSIIETTDKVLDEIRFTADSEGIRFSVLDRGHVSFFNANFEREYFDTYKIEEPETFTVATGELLQVLRRGKNDEDMTITVTDSNLIILFTGAGKRKFTINLIETDYSSPTAPQLNLPVNDICISFKEFKETIKDCNVFGDKFKIKADKNEFIISGGDEFGGYEGNIYVDESLESVASIFAIDKIQDTFKLEVTDELLICLGNDTPLILKWNDNFGLEVSYLLAPRIEEEM